MLMWWRKCCWEVASYMRPGKAPRDEAADLISDDLRCWSMLRTEMSEPKDGIVK